jgi:RHS repeat-associated protein
MVDVLTGNMYYYGNDKLGTPQIMTDSTNTVVWEGEYKPFGKADVNPNSSLVNNFRFPGQYYDSETGLNYNYHRYYDPKTGRYVTADPIGLEGGINLFTYVSNNPANATDPLGLEESNSTKKCVGKARVLKGNSKHIGKWGGFGPRVTINSSSVAIDPSQWGNKESLRPHLSQIIGRTGDKVLFDNVAEIIGGERLKDYPDLNVRDGLRKKYPDALITELPGGEKDYGIVDIELTIPCSLPCPEGTLEVK